MDTWKFINNNADFLLTNATKTRGLYFPLANEAGYMASITPQGGGDAKTDQHHFLMPPVSIVDLHNSRLGRTVWLEFDEEEPWSLTGSSHWQKAQADETHNVKAGFLWHSLERLHRSGKVSAEMCSFVPATSEHLELTRIRISNNSERTLKIRPLPLVPLYGRSADSLRDHRHVTSLLNTVGVQREGVVLKPTMSFDERGHKANSTVYAVMGQDEQGGYPIGCFPDVNGFIGEAGDAEKPEAVFNREYNKVLLSKPGSIVHGCEAIGALQFPVSFISAGGTMEYYLVSGVFSSEKEAQKALTKYASKEFYEAALQKTKDFWQAKLQPVFCETGDTQFNLWMRWVSLQPVLRRIYGCSFLPYHDYGRGGRGWRDLWQDCLALLLMEPETVRESLLQNLAGVRFDGTNATIIGQKQGEFIADRNNIPRVWMDHGAWPFMTIRLYLDQSGDFAFLFEKQTYFSDRLWARAKETLKKVDINNTILLNQNREVFYGTVLEHLLLQQLSVFFHVGKHNTIRLEGADWNDGLDMAYEQGESVAFTGLYAANLHALADILDHVSAVCPQALMLAEELRMLLDRYTGKNLDYSNPDEKNACLKEFFETCKDGPSGRFFAADIKALTADLREKAESIVDTVRASEWVTNSDGKSWFNGYYDNAGRRVEGDAENGVRMTLTGQVFQVLSGVANEQQVEQILEAAESYLWDPAVGGYRLNTDFQECKLDLGRCFGFAYGHKENGAMFSHMAVMFANALYIRRKSDAAWRIMETIYKAASNFSQSRMYPGIPEYFDPLGRGLYPYLTGSASWYLLTLVTQCFGIRGHYGNLLLDPQLTRKQWAGKQTLSMSTYFRQNLICVEYTNSQELDSGSYCVKTVIVNEKSIPFAAYGDGALLYAENLPKKDCCIRVVLGSQDQAV